MVIFKNLTKASEGTFPKDIVIESTKGDAMKRSIMESRYGPHLWKKDWNVFSSRANFF